MLFAIRSINLPKVNIKNYIKKLVFYKYNLIYNINIFIICKLNIFKNDNLFYIFIKNK